MTNSPTLDRALAQIDVAFGKSAFHKLRKDRIRDALRPGAGDLLRRRFGGRAQLLRPYALSGAIRATERWYEDEKASVDVHERFKVAYSRLSLEVLRDLRVMLRLARRYDMRRFYRALIDIATDARP